jgi:spore coat protein CotH
MRLTNLSLWALLGAIVVVLGAPSCGGGSDGDADVDADGDGDTDADTDTDVDGDADGDGDADVDGDGDSDIDGDVDGDGDVDTDGDGDTGTVGLVINEAMASPPDGELDWIELLATGDLPVSLSDYTLVDDGDHAPNVLPDVTLAPGEHHVVIASREPPPDGSFHVTFQLGRNDSLTLARDGVEVDFVEWTEDDVPEGASWGRYPDGSGDAQALDPTPGETNVPWDEPARCNGDDVFLPDAVQVVRIEIAPEDWDAIRLDPEAEVYYPANIVIGERRVDEVAFRTKGNASLRTIAESGSNRFPFKVDMNRYVTDQELCDERLLNLSPGFLDPTFMREHLSFAMARDFDIPAPRTGYVDLYVNELHLGLYVLVEAVDGDFVDERFDVETGDLYIAEPPGGTLEYRGSGSFADYRGMQLETNEETSDHGAFLDLVTQLNRGRISEIDRVLDVEEVLRYLAFNTLLTNLDSYLGPGHNYYLYEEDGVFHVIPWDLNETFGTFNCSCDRARLIGFLIDEPTCGPLAQRPLVARLLSVPMNRDTYHGFLEELLDTTFTEEAMNDRIVRVHDLILPYVEADPTSPYDVATFERSLNEDVVAGGTGDHTRMAIGLRAFVRERRASIEAQLAGAAPSTNGGLGACAGGGNPCGDGVCDEFERANPDVCPEDCM